MLRVKFNWSGGPMGPGVSTFHVQGGSPEDATDAQNASDNIRAFFVACASTMATGYTVSPSSIVESINDETGIQTAEFTVTSAGTVTSTGSGSYAAGVGVRVRWRTDDFDSRGKRIYGTTFIVPASGAVFEADGTIGGSRVADLLTAANGLMTANTADGLQLVVWKRPSAPGASDGDMRFVTGPVIPDQASWLTSRRR